MSSIPRHLVSSLPRLFALVLLTISLAACQTAQLNTASLLGTGAAYTFPYGQPEVRGHSAIVIDYETGRTLYQDEPDGLRYPASLSKLMTLYLLFDAIEAGRLSLDSQLTVSENAAAKPASKLYLTPGSTIRVRDAIQALTVKSANDVATVIGENLGGSELGFAAQMNAKARALGMSRSHFDNPSGLPDPGQISTARDMAALARAIRSRFPVFAPFFSLEEFTWKGKTLRSTNKLLGKVPGVDGMKTGYINDSGSNLVASATRNGRRVIVAVLGGPSARERDAEVTALIDRYLGPAPQMVTAMTPGVDAESELE